MRPSELDEDSKIAALIRLFMRVQPSYSSTQRIISIFLAHHEWKDRPANVLGELSFQQNNIDNIISVNKIG